MGSKQSHGSIPQFHGSLIHGITLPFHVNSMESTIGALHSMYPWNSTREWNGKSNPHPTEISFYSCPRSIEIALIHSMEFALRVHEAPLHFSGWSDKWNFMFHGIVAFLSIYTVYTGSVFHRLPITMSFMNTTLTALGHDIRSCTCVCTYLHVKKCRKCLRVSVCACIVHPGSLCVQH